MERLRLYYESYNELYVNEGFVNIVTASVLLLSCPIWEKNKTQWYLRIIISKDLTV